MTRLAVVSAGLRSPSSTRMLADRLAEAAARELDGPVTTTVVEVREHAHAIADALLTGFPSEELDAALVAVQDADAVIMVSPTFQGTFSGLFKSFVDLLAEGTMRHKPVLLGATGGTERHSLVVDHALRPLFAYLGSSIVPTGVYAATGDFGTHTEALERRVRRAASELGALARVTWPTNQAQPLSDPLAEAQRTLGQATGTQSGDFGDLLRSLGQD